MSLALLLIAQVVSLQVPDHRAEGRLALRLLDEGYDVASRPGPVEDGLHLRQTDRGYAVLWQGRTEAIEARTPAVSEVAAIQAVVIRLADAHETPSRVRRTRLVWYTGLSAQVRADWVHRLLARGHVLTTRASGADRGLCIVDSERARPGPVNDPCAAPPPARAAPPAGPAVPAAAPAVATATTSEALPRTPRIVSKPPAVPRDRAPVSGGAEPERGPERARTATTSADPGPLRPARPVDPEPFVPPVPTPLHLDLEAAAGLTPHSQGVDPSFAMSGTFWWSWLGLRASALGVFASADTLSVFEGVLSVGPSARWSWHPDWAVQGGFLLGARWHRWRLADGGGLRTDLAVDVPITVRWRATDRIDVGLTARPAVNTRARRHIEDAQVLWQRDVFRFTGLVSVGLRLF